MTPLGGAICIVLGLQIFFIGLGLQLRPKYRKASSDKKVTMGLVVGLFCGLGAFLAMIVKNKPTITENFMVDHDRKLINHLQEHNDMLEKRVHVQAKINEIQTKRLEIYEKKIEELEKITQDRKKN